MNGEPTRCVYEQTAHGRCFRPTMDESGLCVYHTPKALAARKPRRLTRKKLEAIHKAAVALEAALTKREAINGTHAEWCDCIECQTRGRLRELLK